MTESHDIRAPERHELESLFAEIRLYLDVVEAFRREGREPHWRDGSPETEVLK